MMNRIISMMILQLFSLCTTAHVVHPPGDSAAVNVFYSKMQQKIVWLTPGKKSNLQVLAGFFRQAPYLGLEEQDYEAQFIYEMAEDSLDILPGGATMAADRRITMEALRFFCDVAYGPVNNTLVRYNGLGTLADRYSRMPDLLADCLRTDSFDLFLQRVEPADTAYTALKQAFAYFHNALAGTGFTETPVVSLKADTTNVALISRLRQIGLSRVITGKRSTPTPTLASRITEVILYPYWMVPYRIATRELLPHIKRDRHYLDDNQFEVLDRKGRITDPASINWQSLSISNFPYIIRQNTGCDNSLGIIKLNFYSPFTVYLHDTPGKSLFMLKQRFFSHGCIRVEEAVTLARLLLDDTSAGRMDALIKEGPQPDQKPVVIPVKSTVLVFVLYNTAWPDYEGRIRFYEDVYKKY